MRAPALRISGVSAACIKPFDGAVDNKARLLQRADHRSELLDRDAGAG